MSQSCLIKELKALTIKALGKRRIWIPIIFQQVCSNAGILIAGWVGDSPDSTGKRWLIGHSLIMFSATAFDFLSDNIAIQRLRGDGVRSKFAVNKPGSYFTLVVQLIVFIIGTWCARGIDNASGLNIYYLLVSVFVGLSILLNSLFYQWGWFKVVFIDAVVNLICPVLVARDLGPILLGFSALAFFLKISILILLESKSDFVLQTLTYANTINVIGIKILGIARGLVPVFAFKYLSSESQLTSIQIALLAILIRGLISVVALTGNVLNVEQLFKPETIILNTFTQIQIKLVFCLYSACCIVALFLSRWMVALLCLIVFEAVMFCFTRSFRKATITSNPIRLCFVAALVYVGCKMSETHKMFILLIFFGQLILIFGNHRNAKLDDSQ